MTESLVKGSSLLKKKFELIVDNVPICPLHLCFDFIFLEPNRASFVSYRNSLYSAVSSISSRFVPPSFLTGKEIPRWTKKTSARQVGLETVLHIVRLVREVNVLESGHSIVFGVPMKSKSLITFGPFLQTRQSRTVQQLLFTVVRMRI